MLDDAGAPFGAGLYERGQTSELPEEAVRAFKDLEGGTMIPMHYGSFRLSHEPIEEPLQLLEREAVKAGVKDKVVVLEEGVTRFF